MKECIMCRMDKNGECVFCRMKKQDYSGKRVNLSQLSSYTPNAGGLSDRYSTERGARAQWQDLKETAAYIKGMADAIGMTYGFEREDSRRKQYSGLPFLVFGKPEANGEYCSDLKYDLGKYANKKSSESSGEEYNNGGEE